MGGMHFDDVWNLILSLEGEQFQTKTGLPFTYEVRGNIAYSSRAQYPISRSDFERVVEIGPFDGPGPICYLVRGPAYVWAILHDPRVKHVAWPAISSRGHSVG